MNSTQKTLRILCIITVIMAILCIIVGVLSMGAGGLIGIASTTNEGASELAAQGYDSSTGVAAGVLVGALGVGIIISGIIDLIIGLLGMRGAKDPSKIGPFWVFCIIGIVLNALSVIGCFMQGADATNIVSNIISLALVVWCFFLANKIKTQA